MRPGRDITIGRPVPGHTAHVLDESLREEVEPDKVRRVIVCSGKVAYDLIRRRDEKKAWDVAVIRIEQLYPFPQNPLRVIMTRFKQAQSFCWAQDEPENMGAWPHLRIRFGSQLLGTHPLSAVCRPVSASPASTSSNSQ